MNIKMSLISVECLIHVTQWRYQTTVGTSTFSPWSHSGSTRLVHQGDINQTHHYCSVTHSSWWEDKRLSVPAGFSAAQRFHLALSSRLLHAVMWRSQQATFLKIGQKKFGKEKLQQPQFRRSLQRSALSENVCTVAFSLCTGGNN